MVRYRELVEDAHAALDRVSRFLGIEEGVVTEIPSGNSRPFVNESVRTKVLGPVVRAGASAGQFLPPEVWRAASRPIVGQLHQRGNPERPRLTEEQGEELRQPFREDITLLESVTGQSFDDWRRHRSGGTFHTRRSETAST